MWINKPLLPVTWHHKLCLGKPKSGPSIRGWHVPQWFPTKGSTAPMQVFWTCVGCFDYTVTGILLSFSTQGPGMLNILQWPERSLMMKSRTAKMPTALLLRNTKPLSVFFPYTLILLWGSSPNPSSLWNFPQTLHSHPFSVSPSLVLSLVLMFFI